MLELLQQWLQPKGQVYLEIGSRIYRTKYKSISSRLVFTSDRVVIGVVIRSVERYDLVKIKPSQKQNTDSAYNSVAYDLVKTALSESQAEAEE